MISTGLAAAILVVSVALTYFVCIRPMKNGQCAMSSRMPAGNRADHTDQQAQIEELREQIKALKRQGVHSER